VDAGFATFNRLLSKQRDWVIAVFTELRADTARRHASIAMDSNVEQVLRLIVGAIDIVSHQRDPPSPAAHRP
jgi:hypothetical protein